jgi:hypothetical protein
MARRKIPRATHFRTLKTEDDSLVDVMMCCCCWTKKTANFFFWSCSFLGTSSHYVTKPVAARRHSDSHQVGSLTGRRSHKRTVFHTKQNPQIGTGASNRTRHKSSSICKGVPFVLVIHLRSGEYRKPRVDRGVS